MLVPLSLLKDYVKITLPESKLSEKLTEAGLGVENIEEKEGEKILDLEVTPNRPDWLSVVGVAREIASLENLKVALPKVSEIKKPAKILPLKIKTDYRINPRFTGIIISNVNVEDSPQWLKERLIKIGMRPINNIVDITNFVMYELGNPLHAFDYDKIEGHQMSVGLSMEGESFESVDAVTYHLPKGAVVIRDSKKIIDLCGIKGGKNSGIYSGTKNVFIRVPVEVPNLIRKTSAKLGLRSDASSIFEKGVDAGNTVFALKRCVGLILKIAGGAVASEIYDLKEDRFEFWRLKVAVEKLNKIIGTEIPQKQTLGILESLNLSPKITKEGIECKIPTYRNDLKIEEDLIEEVARLYGYNKIEKKMPAGQIPVRRIEYFKDYSTMQKAKEILVAAGFSEIKSYSLVSEVELDKFGLNSKAVLRVDNPVSREFEYLRPTLKIGLAKGLAENKKFTSDINLFELGKTYRKKDKKATEEYFLACLSSNLSFAQLKGIIQKLFSEFGIKNDTSSFIEVLGEALFFEINFSEIETKANTQKIYKPIPKYPPIIEDLSIEVSKNFKTGDIIEHIKKQSPLIYDVSLIDEFENSKTFHIVYQDREKNLTRADVSKIREEIIKALKNKFLATSN
ncbi:MAG: phenylalanine--tRNA ligase subunit beta [Candidatus Levybacteria bacterium]|nr:phenylalanine--tRNA ligase subunit beta [Candidatus Levybacteria bacterium]